MSVNRHVEYAVTCANGVIVDTTQPTNRAVAENWRDCFNQPDFSATHQECVPHGLVQRTVTDWVEA